VATPNFSNIAFSGLFCAGKDFVAEASGFECLSVAEPMYAACRHFFGFCDKTRADHRAFLQDCGQLGWGCPEIQPDPLRAAWMIWWFRNRAADELGSEWVSYNWGEFGKRSDFWIDILLKRNAAKIRCAVSRVAVTNCRFEHEQAPLVAAGFRQYLVMCSESTREVRNGGPIPKATGENVSERYARQLALELPDSQIIWNDDPVLMPKGRKYLSVEEFKKSL